MKTLKQCLRSFKGRFSDQDIAALIDNARDYKEDGHSPDEANQKSIREMIGVLTEKRAKLVLSANAAVETRKKEIVATERKNQERRELLKKKSGPDTEHRYLVIGDAEVRVVKEKNKPTKIVGYFAKFDKFSENLGGFREIIQPGFFRDALKTSDAVDLFNHDPNYILGRMSAKTLKVWEDKVGLAYECIAPDTDLIRDMVISPIERGDLKGNSFGFRVKGNGDSWDEDSEGRIVRTLLTDGCAELLDGSQVTYPSYGDTDVALRSKDQWKEKRATDAEQKKIDEAVQKKLDEKAAADAVLEEKRKKENDEANASLYDIDLKKKRLALKEKMM